MKKLTIFFASFIPLALVSLGFDNSSESMDRKSKPYANAKIEIKTFINDCSPLLFALSPTQPGEGNWGYDIYIYGVLYVHQSYIPAIKGNQGFKKEEDAVKTAQLVVDKIRNNVVPLNVTVQELDRLGVLK